MGGWRLQCRHGGRRRIEARRNLPLHALVFASSAAVYGFSDEPLSEESPIRPVDVYGLSKQRGEELVQRFSQESPNLRVVTGRFFMERMLPETAAHLARIQAGAASLMELPAEAF